MVRLILFCLLSPAIYAQPYKIKDPNEEPFLPIHPVYPYSPKLIKRGTETESTLQLTPEAPKIDAKDSYSFIYNNNQQRDSYYSNYDPYFKNNFPSSAQPSYNSDVYANLPYVTYPTQYEVNPASYPSPPYLNYYQPSYYYPHYFNQASLSLSTPSSSVGYQETSQDSTEIAENDKQNKNKQNKNKQNKNKQITQPKENENQNASTSQFVEGGNYISNNLRDLDGQSSIHRLASPYNQLDAQAKDLPIFLPRTTYRVISVTEQPISPDYSLPASYVKVQQVEQLMANLLPQKQAGQSYENNRNVLNSANDGSYANQDAYTLNTPSSTLSGAKTKTGVTYVINADDTAKVNRQRTNLRDAPFQEVSNKNIRYSSHYVQKPKVSQTMHASSDSRNQQRNLVIDRRPTNHRYDDKYDSTYNQASKQEQNYRNDQNQSGSHQDKIFIVVPQTPRSYNYEYSAYELNKAPQTQQDKINPDGDNFGNKQHNNK